ncbi:MAG: ParA family protein [Dehalococcoidia bacterium]
MSARIVAFVNQKGGVGKTTTAVNVAASLAKHGQRVCLVDLDPQANATSASGAPSAGSGSYELLRGDATFEECVVELGDEGFSMVPARPDLAGAEAELVPLMARERRLAAALEPGRQRFDWILIDCPPSLGLITINALTAADSVIIPVQCEYLALEGLSHVSETLELVRTNLNPALRIFGVVLTMFDARTRLSQMVVDEVRSHFADLAFDTVVPRSVRLSEAPSFQQSIFRYDATSRGATAYDALGREILARAGAPV